MKVRVKVRVRFRVRVRVGVRVRDSARVTLCYFLELLNTRLTEFGFCVTCLFDIGCQ